MLPSPKFKAVIHDSVALARFVLHEISKWAKAAPSIRFEAVLGRIFAGLSARPPADSKKKLPEMVLILQAPQESLFFREMLVKVVDSLGLQNRQSSEPVQIS